MTHCQKVLALLSDYKPHSHHSLYALNVIAHSRIADLRRKGHVINHWRDHGTSYYQLVPLDRLPAPSPAGSQSSGPPTRTESEVTSCALGEKETRRGGPLTSSGPEPRAAFPASQLDNPRAASGPEQLPIFEVRKEPAWR